MFKSVKLRRLVVFCHDLAAIYVAFVLAFYIRFDFSLPYDQSFNLQRGLPWVMGIQAAVFVSQGLYRGLWSYASLRDLGLIIRSALLGVGLSAGALAFLFDRLINWPRSVFLMDGVLLVLLLGGGRFAYRFLRENFNTFRKGTARDILIVGAGNTGDLIAREFRLRPELPARVVGFLDDDLQKRGASIHGVNVLGRLDDLSRVLDKKSVDEIIIAIPSLAGARVKAILTESQKRGIPVRIAPPLKDVLLGKIELSQLREVRVEDLLRRDVVQIDRPGVNSFFREKRVLVTGAGGSIGSELCRQILEARPTQLILVERAEFNLYRFLNELKQSGMVPAETTVVPVMADILDERRLTQVFSDYRPQIVVHAAAYKHVPLLEENSYEAIQNNVIGTYLVASHCSQHGVERLLNISTDKAVRPTNVLGASKRMAERVVNEVAKATGLKAISVRFGNVLDSEGSALPLFREQIERGGPVTVTHPEVTRYFMTIPEASALVLQALVLGQGGEIFLLDMGEPVKIRELAEDLIRLSGLEPYTDIDVQFTGLRPGEKLYEELLIDADGHEKTSHPKIFYGARDLMIPLPENWAERLKVFATAEAVISVSQIKDWICDWVPEYGPTASSAADMDEAPSASESERGYLH